MYKALITTLLLTSLTACGGGGDTRVGPPNPNPGFADRTATGTIILSGVSLDSGARETSALTGTLNGDDDVLKLGALSGRVNSDRTKVALISGGQIELDSADTTFARVFEATPTGGNRTVGVVGEAATNIPTTGATTYAGTSQLTIQDGVNIYDLTGNSSVVANFRDGVVVSTIDDLAGIQQSGLEDPISVSNVATISFAGSEIDGQSFAGGTAALTSDNITPLSGSEQNSLNGAFFGTDAAEAGASFIIDDAAGGAVIPENVLVYG